jgi:hypothetical protein
MHAHSLAEAKLYLLVQKCDACGRGPVRAASCAMADEAAGEMVATITARCDACAASTVRRFRLVRGSGSHEQGQPVHPASPVGPQLINPTDHPSELLDVGQWITLAVMLMESADREADAVKARQLRIEAGLCLDEAIKFYTDDENDLPPPQAIFTGETRERFRRQPEQFSRRRLRSMRVKLPKSSGLT